MSEYAANNTIGSSPLDLSNVVKNAIICDISETGISQEHLALAIETVQPANLVGIASQLPLGTFDDLYGIESVISQLKVQEI